jgi:Rrf2 family protein
MYKISTRGQYALLIMEDLAMNGADKYVPLKLLSHRRNLSVKYLEQILIQLGKAGLVTGIRGSNGGYKLAKAPSEYTAGDILRAMEGDLSPHGLQPDDNNTVVSEGSKEFWKSFDTTVNDYVDSVTLERIAKTSSESVGYDYCI